MAGRNPLFPRRVGPIPIISGSPGATCFESSQWIYELKTRRRRAFAYLADGRCRFISRRGNEMKRFNDLASAIAKELKVTDAVLDGEIVALDRAGRPAFYDLMKRRCEAVYYAFDIIWLNGRDLWELSRLSARRSSAQ